MRLAHALHDDVAHHVTGVVVAAQAGAQVVAGAPERGRALFERIESAGQDGLTAIHRAVPLLRSADRDGVTADDQDLVRDGMELILSGRADIEVVGTAGDGVTTIELARRLRPDVCLMDIRMPRVDGLEATRRLKADPLTAGTAVVVVTTFDLTSTSAARSAPGPAASC